MYFIDKTLKLKFKMTKPKYIKLKLFLYNKC